MRSLRLLATATAVAGILTVVSPVGAARADKPAGGCASDKWGQSVFPLNWQPGDPMDPNGENLLLQLGIAGTIEEFGSLEAGLAAFGFATFEDFYAAVVDPGYNRVDKNSDGLLCFKRFPSQGSKPAYMANTVDNTARSPRHPDGRLSPRPEHPTLPSRPHRPAGITRNRWQRETVGTVNR